MGRGGRSRDPRDVTRRIRGFCSGPLGHAVNCLWHWKGGGGHGEENTLGLTNHLAPPFEGHGRNDFGIFRRKNIESHNYFWRELRKKMERKTYGAGRLSRAQEGKKTRHVVGGPPGEDRVSGACRVPNPMLSFPELMLKQLQGIQSQVPWWTATSGLQ